MAAECPHPVDGKKFFNGVLCCADCWGIEQAGGVRSGQFQPLHEPFGDAVAGSQRRVQFGVPAPERSHAPRSNPKVPTEGERAAALMRSWLDAQLTRGLVDDKERAVVERLAADVEAGG